jgi:hypothetical protein
MEGLGVAESVDPGIELAVGKVVRGLSLRLPFQLKAQTTHAARTEATTVTTIVVSIARIGDLLGTPPLLMKHAQRMY